MESHALLVCREEAIPGSQPRKIARSWSVWCTASSKELAIREACEKAPTLDGDAMAVVHFDVLTGLQLDWYMGTAPGKFLWDMGSTVEEARQAGEAAFSALCKV